MKLVFTFLCAGAAVFMLRFLSALLREQKSPSPRPIRVYFAKFNPAKRRGELIIMNSNNSVNKSATETGKRAALIVLAAVLLTLPLHGQNIPADAPAAASVSPNPQASAATPQTDQEIIQELVVMKKRIEQLEAALKQHVAAEQPTTVVQSAKASTPVVPAPPVAPAAAPVEQSLNISPSSATAVKKAKIVPFSDWDWTWLNGNPRTKDAAFDSKFFTPEIRADVTYTYDFNKPKDNSIGGSSEIFRSNEIQLEQLGVGGDFHYDNVRARLMTQFGMYSETTPRNDPSPAKGQWDLDTAYRYVSEAYGGYHINALDGINIDAGIFMSYIGLFSYYNFDNWAYQPSYVSSNTPWFFNGLRVQIFPNPHLKIEPWFINGWQSYGSANSRKGVGGQIKWTPYPWMNVISNNYGLGHDDLYIPNRGRIHTDDSIEIKYFDKPGNFLDKMAFSFTGDMGCEFGPSTTTKTGVYLQGVGCLGNTKDAKSVGGDFFKAGINPKQSFIGYMFYNRFWFHRDRFGSRPSTGKRQSRLRSVRPTLPATLRTRLRLGIHRLRLTTCPVSTSPSAGNTIIATPTCPTGRAREESRRRVRVECLIRITDIRNSLLATTEIRRCNSALAPRKRPARHRAARCGSPTCAGTSISLISIFWSSSRGPGDCS